MQSKLRQIDEKLINLLGQRIVALAESSSLDLEEKVSNYQTTLNDAGVPEFIWHNILIGCTAALKSKKLSPTHVKPRRVTVIGGQGVMGRFFSEQLFSAGHYVSILDVHDWQQAELLLGKADLVLVCVPIDCILEVISKASKYLSPNTALADITSIKAPIMTAMLEYHTGAVMGLHPMFGFGVTSFLSQKIVVCPGRKSECFQWFLDFLENEGAKLILSTPEEHDQMMVVVQAIRHFYTLSLSSFLSEEKVDVQRSLDFSTPLYRQEISIISRLITQSAPMVVDIMLATQERRDAIVRLANSSNRLAQLVIQGKRDLLISELQRVQKFLAKELVNNDQESNYVLNALTTLVAANEVKENFIPRTSQIATGLYIHKN
jgi:prephenate dehydrogenase